MKIINTTNASKTIGPYSQAIEVDKFVYVSGQIPVNPETNEMPDNIQDQTHQSLLNIENILKEANLTLNDVVRCGVFLKDLNQFTQMNEVYEQFFKEHKPVRAAVEVARLPKDAMIEIEAIAYRK